VGTVESMVKAWTLEKKVSFCKVTNFWTCISGSVICNPDVHIRRWHRWKAMVSDVHVWKLVCEFFFFI